jgi:hypothetical protein
MAGTTVDLATQIAARAPGATMVGGNARVKGTPGLLGTQSDILNFGNGAVGNWIVVNTRTTIQGVFAVSQSAQGMAQPPPTAPPVPVVVTAGDTRIKSM